MIGSGHMYKYIVKWENLTKYLQQGWEALNGLITLLSFCGTNIDGHNSGSSTQLKSKLVPTAKLIQQWSFWICDLVPKDLWDDNFVIPETNAQNDTLAAPQDTDDIVFDTEELVEV